MGANGLLHQRTRQHPKDRIAPHNGEMIRPELGQPSAKPGFAFHGPPKRTVKIPMHQLAHILSRRLKRLLALRRVVAAQLAQPPHMAKSRLGGDPRLRRVLRKAGDQCPRRAGTCIRAIQPITEPDRSNRMF